MIIDKLEKRVSKLSNKKFAILVSLIAVCGSLGGVYLRDVRYDEITRGDFNALEISALMQKERILTYDGNPYRFEVDSLGTPYLVPYKVENLDTKIIENSN